MHQHTITRRLLSLWLIILSVSTGMQGARISRSQASQIASQFYHAQHHGTTGTSTPAAPMRQVTAKQSDEMAYYIFTPSASDRGFVIVAADDTMDPIVGYSHDTAFDPDHMPDALRAYLSDYSRVAGAIAAGDIAYKRATRGGQAVSPIITTRWDQGEPFNRLTPLYGSSHAPAGCVAVAIAQVMKHYNYPPSGHGTAGEFNYSNQSQTVALGHSYNWADMAGHYGYDGTGQPTYTEAQAEAVAVLLRDVAYAVNMRYSSDFSGAPTCDIVPALVRHFNYSPDVRYIDRESCSTQYWTDQIRGSLLKGRPVLYSGSDGRTGHEFVCDGIDADDMLHINWGWGGYGDGYFDMNILSPEYLGTGAGNGAYYRDQDIVTDMHPGDPSADNSAWRAPLTVTRPVIHSTIDDDGRFTSDFNVGFRLYNTSGTSIERYTYASAILISKADGTPVGIYGARSVSAFGVGYYFNFGLYFNITELIDNGTMTDGHYTASVVTLPYDRMYEPTLDDARPVSSGDLCEIGLTVRDGQLYLDDTSLCRDSQTPRLKVVKANTDGTLFAGTTAQYAINTTLLNTASTVVDNYYNVYLIPQSEDTPDINLYNYTSVGGNQIFIYPGVQNDAKIICQSTPDTPGRYRVYVSDSDKPLPDDEPQYIDISSLPSDRVCMTTALTLDKSSYPRDGYVRFGFEFSFNNPGQAYNSDIELWTRRIGDPTATEIPLIRKSGQSVRSGINTVNISEYCEANAVWYEELGQYDAYIKYTDPNGVLQVMPGDNNHASFTLIESDMPCLAELSSPMVINNGRPVLAQDWTYFDIEFEITSPTGLDIPDDNNSIDVYRSERGSDWLYSFVTSTITFDSKHIEPGGSTRVHANILFRLDDTEQDIIGQTLYVQFNYLNTTAGTCRVRPGKYIDSIAFRLVRDYSAIDTIQGDSGKTIVSSTYYDMLGRQVAAPLTGTLYIEHTTYTDGTTAVRKIIR